MINDTSQATAARLGPSQHAWDTYPGYFLSVWKLPPGDGALAQPQDYRAGWNLDHGVMGIMVGQCQDRQKSMTACEEFQMVEDALSAGVGVRQPREGLTWVNVPVGSQLHTPYHNFSKLNHAIAMPLPLLQGQGKPTTPPGHRHGSGETWEEAQAESASPRAAMQLAVSCHPLLTLFAFCLLKAALCFYSNENAELCWDSCCHTANIWKWEGIPQHHERNGPLAPGWKLKQAMAAAVD